MVLFIVRLEGLENQKLSKLTILFKLKKIR